jgi:hypothetical protein
MLGAASTDQNLNSKIQFLHEFSYKLNKLSIYRGADKSLALPDLKETMKGRHFSSDAEVIAAAETWLDGQHFEFFFLSGLQKLEFGRCSLFPSWSG